jgi:hypothetical protein
MLRKQENPRVFHVKHIFHIFLFVMFLMSNLSDVGLRAQEFVGKGEWILMYTTEDTNGDGCSSLNFIGREIRTGLQIEQYDFQLCTPDSPACACLFKWKASNAYFEFVVT